MRQSWINKLIDQLRPTRAPELPRDPFARIFTLLDLLERPRTRAEETTLTALTADLIVRGDLGRRWRRISQVAPAKLVTGGMRYSALVADVSAGGFRIASRTKLVMDQRLECEVVFAGVRYAFPCRVSWHNEKNGWYGLAIDGRPSRKATPPEVIAAGSQLLRRHAATLVSPGP